MAGKYDKFLGEYREKDAGGSGGGGDIPSGTTPGVITGTTPVMLLLGTTPTFLAFIDGIWKVVGGGGTSPYAILDQNGLAVLDQNGLSIVTA